MEESNTLEQAKEGITKMMGKTFKGLWGNQDAQKNAKDKK